MSKMLMTERAWEEHRRGEAKMNRRLAKRNRQRRLVMMVILGAAIVVAALALTSSAKADTEPVVTVEGNDAPEYKECTVEYTVQNGDTLTSIARYAYNTYGNAISVNDKMNEIERDNKISESDILRAGTVIELKYYE